MAISVDEGGDTLYVADIVFNDSAPGTLSGTSLATTTTNVAGVGTGISATGSTLTLTAAQAGSVIAFNRAAGTTVTLPAPVLGMEYTFVIGTVATSNAQKIITNTGTVFIAGGLDFDKSLTITRYDGNTTTFISLNLNGTTTGGATIGDVFRIYAVSATQWAVAGTVTASGTLATPFATS
jgi:hypothetical protein